jgi:hypothetical protein
MTGAASRVVTNARKPGARGAHLVAMFANWSGKLVTLAGESSPRWLATGESPVPRLSLAHPATADTATNTDTTTVRYLVERRFTGFLISAGLLGRTA